MAQQAFLAKQRRQLARSGTHANLNYAAGAGSNPPGEHAGESFLHRYAMKGTALGKTTNVVKAALVENRDRLSGLFSVWDVNGDSVLSKAEFRRAVKMMGVVAQPRDLESFFVHFDKNENGCIELSELLAILDIPDVNPNLNSSFKADRPSRCAALHPVQRALTFVFWVANTLTMQTLLYIAFVATTSIFLTGCLRSSHEYYLDKAMNDILFNNVFDSALNKFDNVRRIADIWEWGNAVLWPGLLGNGEPICAEAGLAGMFRSADPRAPTSNDWSIPCNDDTLPDGDGELARVGATPPTVAQVVARFNELDWTEGLLITQSRVRPQTDAACRTGTIGGICLPEYGAPLYLPSSTPFGYNWMAETRSLPLPFLAYTAAELGTQPLGDKTASPASLRQYPPGGFASVVIPFFSDTYLPEQRGLAASIRDFRDYRASRENERVPRYFCVRLSWDGAHIHQLCDPNDPKSGRTTGVVRAAILEFWNDLKRAHYLDANTRLLQLTMPINSNHVGVRSRVRIFFELTSTGAVLPSYDSQTRVSYDGALSDLGIFLWAGLALALYFCLMEVIEILGLEDGTFDIDDVANYVTDMWNVMDWLCYVMYFIAFIYGRWYIQLVGSPGCSQMCETVGYRDDYLVMEAARDLKLYLSITTCIQLLKLLKVLNLLVPKMGLAPAVLKKALPDLVAFALVFAISVNAFSSLFYIQLGPVMIGYYDRFTAFISLGRALFGDFDIDEILANSPSYLNTTLYLVYLFVAVFILLSMFLAILGEAQANLRDDQRAQRKQGDVQPEYGVIDTALKIVLRGAERLPGVGPQLRRKKEDALAVNVIKENEKKVIAPVDRIEARQLEMQDELLDLATEVTKGLGALHTRLDRLSGADKGALPGAQADASSRGPRDKNSRPVTPVPALSGESTRSGGESLAVIHKLQHLEELVVALTAKVASTPQRRKRHVSSEDESPAPAKDRPPRHRESSPSQREHHKRTSTTSSRHGGSGVRGSSVQQEQLGVRTRASVSFERTRDAARSRSGSGDAARGATRDERADRQLANIRLAA